MVKIEFNAEKSTKDMYYYEVTYVYEQPIHFIPIDIKIKNTLASATDIDIPKATGADLDRLAELWGFQRNSGESDDDLSHRIRANIATDGFGNNIDSSPFQLWDPDKDEIAPIKASSSEKKKCECGAASLGYDQPGPGHASWCPIASK